MPLTHGLVRRFVVKTQDMATSRKVFINMCCHPKVAAPGNWANGTMPESVQNALENMDNLSEAEVRGQECGAMPYGWLRQRTGPRHSAHHQLQPSRACTGKHAALPPQHVQRAAGG